MSEALGGKHQVKVTLKDSDYARISAAADRAGMPISTWLRMKALEALREEGLAGFRVGVEKEGLPDE